MFRQVIAGLRADVTHKRVHKPGQRPRFAKSDKGMPVIGHDNERAEKNALVLNSEGKRLDDNLAQGRIQHRLFRSQCFCDKKGCRNIPQPVKTQVLGMGV
jgi:hypothetical protein